MDANSVLRELRKELSAYKNNAKISVMYAVCEHAETLDKLLSKGEELPVAWLKASRLLDAEVATKYLIEEASDREQLIAELVDGDEERRELIMQLAMIRLRRSIAKVLQDIDEGRRRDND